MSRNLSFRRCLAALLVAAVALLTGCVGQQTHSSVQHRVITLQANDLEQDGITVITPSTVTTQEGEKQAVALTFSDVLIAERPKIRVITLPLTLNAINRAGLATDYREMFAAYRDTGIFAQDTLHRIGGAIGARYVAHLNLAQFSHYSKQMGVRSCNHASFPVSASARRSARLTVA